ncbi:hypothetical protein E2562_039379 [Oryza meyeriana var. granulata]|uniref:Reverse transcriptase Ty1/copia-type domain-containing protein n=1 Tax=Oryza meyeriana var. granulata TaxID=110450 RepID=A0A6G1CNE8_9ORYZ|nr:hypothetical protein E2562_039379 [Oryza meyeriana var. granulata]
MTIVHSNLLGDGEVPEHAIRELVDGELHLQVSEEPENFKEAESHVHWLAAMQAEMNSILENHTWHLADLPAGHRAIGVKWVYKAVHHMDVKSAFLNGELIEEVYVKQPPGFILTRKEDKVLCLNKGAEF